MIVEPRELWRKPKSQFLNHVRYTGVTFPIVLLKFFFKCVKIDISTAYPYFAD
jgi:hypothetical protein